MIHRRTSEETEIAVGTLNSKTSPQKSKVCQKKGIVTSQSSLYRNNRTYWTCILYLYSKELSNHRHQCVIFCPLHSRDAYNKQMNVAKKTLQVRFGVLGICPWMPADFSFWTKKCRISAELGFYSLRDSVLIQTQKRGSVGFLQEGEKYLKGAGRYFFHV